MFRVPAISLRNIVQMVSMHHAQQLPKHLSEVSIVQWSHWTPSENPSKDLCERLLNENFCKYVAFTASWNGHNIHMSVSTFLMHGKVLWFIAILYILEWCSEQLWASWSKICCSMEARKLASCLSTQEAKINK